MTDKRTTFWCPRCDRTVIVPLPTDGTVGPIPHCPHCDCALTDATSGRPIARERPARYEPSQLLNPMPWWLIAAGSQILCRILVRANVPAWLRESAKKTTNTIDDALLDAMATTIEHIAEGYRSIDQEA